MEKSTRQNTGIQGYRKLRRLIVYGRLPSGMRLGEVEWSQKLQVHRAALREAMTLLAHEGLLCRGERGGYFVREFETRDIVEIVETRQVIETGALKLLSRMTLQPEQLEPLRLLCEQMEQLLESELVFGFVEADRRFHENLVKLSGNAHLSQMFSRSPIPHLLPSTPVIDIHPENLLTSLKEHYQLVELISQRDFASAERLLEIHIARLIPALQRA